MGKQKTQLFNANDEGFGVKETGGEIHVRVTDNSAVNSGGGGGAKLVTEAVALGEDVPVKETIITNYSSGTILYVGFSIDVSPSNGQPLGYLESYVSGLSNLNKIFLVSSGSTDVRYSYES